MSTRSTGRVHRRRYGSGAENVAIGAGDDGLDVDNAATTVTRNLAVHNGDLGIEAVPGVTDGGGNKANANGNPAQCTNVSCS
jgi:predicted transcriptional regulator